jgi:hypothetical protein
VVGATSARTAKRNPGAIAGAVAAIGLLLFRKPLYRLIRGRPRARSAALPAPELAALPPPVAPAPPLVTAHPATETADAS